MHSESSKRLSTTFFINFNSSVPIAGSLPVSSDSPVPPGRSLHAMASRGSLLIVTGGMSGQSVLVLLTSVMLL
jgi:hypothetical protein